MKSSKLSNRKILQVIDRLEVGGAERVFLDLTSLLLNQNVKTDTLLISGKGPLFEKIDGRAKKHFLSRKWKYNPLKIFQCANICSKYDIVHIHMRHTYAYVRLAQILTFKKFKIVFHDHYGDIAIDAKVPFTLKWLFKPKYYIGVSLSLTDWATSRLNLDAQRIFLLRNTIIPSDNFIRLPSNNDLLMISNIRPTKNIEFAIQIANELRRKLTIYGNTTSSKYNEEIKNLINASVYVEVIEGENNIQPFFKNYSLALHTAVSETGPLVLLEYIANGLPFLAYEVGEVAYLLKDEIPECFIKTLNISDWEEKISFLTHTPPSPRKLVKLFEKYFGPDAYIRQCLDIYNQIL